MESPHSNKTPDYSFAHNCTESCFIVVLYIVYDSKNQCTAELQWLEHTWNHENMFKTEVVQANEC